MFLLEAEDSGLLLNVDLLQVLPHLHHLAQKKLNFNDLLIYCPHYNTSAPPPKNTIRDGGSNTQEIVTKFPLLPLLTMLTILSLLSALTLPPPLTLLRLLGLL